IAHKEFHKMCEEKDCDCKQFTPSEEEIKFDITKHGF
ncbi:hypothetical protein LCGC14_2737370, partial [marine sediment metagenome]